MGEITQLQLSWNIRPWDLHVAILFNQLWIWNILSKDTYNLPNRTERFYRYNNTCYISTVICNIPVLVLRCMSKHLRLIHQTYTRCIWQKQNILSEFKCLFSISMIRRHYIFPLKFACKLIDMQKWITHVFNFWEMGKIYFINRNKLFRNIFY